MSEKESEIRKLLIRRKMERCINMHIKAHTHIEKRKHVYIYTHAHT